VVAAGDAGDPRGGALDVLADTIQPFPTPSEIYLKALQELRPTGAGAHCLAAAETAVVPAAPEPGRLVDDP
jgi:hypothetical protein